MMNKGEIWLVDFPSRRGREQTGKRPSIIVADTATDLVLVVPLTSNLQALEKLPYTIQINKSKENKLDKIISAVRLPIKSEWRSSDVIFDELLF